MTLWAPPTKVIYHPKFFLAVFAESYKTNSADIQTDRMCLLIFQARRNGYTSFYVYLMNNTFHSTYKTNIKINEGLLGGAWSAVFLLIAMQGEREREREFGSLCFRAYQPLLVT